MKILVLNGPNLGRLDLRNSAIYGQMDFPALSEFISNSAKELELEVDVRQSDSETELISWLHAGNRSGISFCAPASGLGL